MSRLRFPTRPEAEALTAAPGSVQYDAYSALRQEGGDLVADLSTGSASLTLRYGTEPTAHWSLTVHDGSPAGSAVTLPEALVTRANRLMLTDGVSVQRDWRTKTHVLRAAPRRVLPILNDQAVSAAHTTTGWKAVQTAAVASLTPPTVAPSAPTPVAPAPSVATPEPEPQPDADEAAAPSAPAPDASKRDAMILSRDFVRLWDGVRAANKAGDRLVLAITGPAGSGKTEAAEALTAAEGVEFVKFSAVGVMEPADWFGTVVLDEGGTRFVESDFLKAVASPGERVLLIDEVNRALLRSLNAMLPFMDRSATFVVPQTGKIRRRNPKCQIVVTANIGSAHLGTEPLDEALRDRFVWAEVAHLTEADEARLLLQRTDGLSQHHADALASLGAKIRTNAVTGQHPPVSTRQLLAAAALIARGVPARLAVDSAVLHGYLSEGGPNSQRSKVLPLVTGIVWDEPKPAAPGDVFTAATPDAVCTCGHTPAQHGIGNDIGGTYCRTNDACIAYSPVTAPVGTVGA